MELSDQQINNLAGFILKQQQLNVIRSYSRKADTIFFAPTGYGKSITNQPAPKVLAGKAIVVTPLLSLLQDSIRNSSRFGKCTDLSSTSTDTTSDHIHSDLVFTTAESLIEGWYYSGLATWIPNPGNHVTKMDTYAQFCKSLAGDPVCIMTYSTCKLPLKYTKGMKATSLIFLLVEPFC